MTTPPTDDTLGDRYADLTELGRRAERIRYAATLRDAHHTPVIVSAFAPALAARMPSPDVCIAALERFGRASSELPGAPLAWGRTRDGTIHAAFASGGFPLEPAVLGPAEVADIGVRIARDLAGAHKRGFVHGAITTACIARAPSEQLYVADLGLFVALREGGLRPSDAAIVLSERVYLSPEALRDEVVDARSDVYSLGASLFELLTGKPPHGGRTTSFVMASVLSVDTPNVGHSDAGKQVVGALLRAIERGPDDRWPSMAAFANALASGTMIEDRSDVVIAKRGCLPVAAVVAAARLLTTLFR